MNFSRTSSDKIRAGDYIDLLEGTHKVLAVRRESGYLRLSGIKTYKLVYQLEHDGELVESPAINPGVIFGVHKCTKACNHNQSEDE